jgi:hypothetical protein
VKRVARIIVTLLIIGAAVLFLTTEREGEEPEPVNTPYVRPSAPQFTPSFDAPPLAETR